MQQTAVRHISMHFLFVVMTAAALFCLHPKAPPPPQPHVAAAAAITGCCRGGTPHQFFYCILHQRCQHLCQRGPEQSDTPGAQQAIPVDQHASAQQRGACRIRCSCTRPDDGAGLCRASCNICSQRCATNGLHRPRAEERPRGAGGREPGGCDATRGNSVRNPLPGCCDRPVGVKLPLWCVCKSVCEEGGGGKAAHAAGRRAATDVLQTQITHVLTEHMQC